MECAVNGHFHGTCVSLGARILWQKCTLIPSHADISLPIHFDRVPLGPDPVVRTLGSCPYRSRDGSGVARSGIGAPARPPFRV